MKKRGSTSDFAGARDEELYRNFMDLLRTADMPLREMFSAAARRPSSRFWVSEPRAEEVVSAMLRGTNKDVVEKMYPQKRKMYEEITRRVRARMQADSTLCVTHAVDAVIYEEAPEFYLTDESARLLIYRHRRRVRESKARNNNLRNALGKFAK